jgi:hypothetical protein
MFAREKEESIVMAQRIAIAEIDWAVAGRLGPTRVTGNAQPAVFNRQVAIYLAKALGGWGITKIGKFYNRRHHTTVRYAIRRIEALAPSMPIGWLVAGSIESGNRCPATGCHRRIHLFSRTAAANPRGSSHRRILGRAERIV